MGVDARAIAYIFPTFLNATQFSNKTGTLMPKGLNKSSISLIHFLSTRLRFVDEPLILYILAYILLASASYYYSNLVSVLHPNVCVALIHNRTAFKTQISRISPKVC